MLDEAEI